jgi:hypothetical protein
MADATLYWTKVAAIGQVAGASATFFAAVIALYFARSERLIRLRVRAKFGRVVDSLGSTSAVFIEVENTGLRTARITMIGWTTGYVNYLRFLPKFLRLKSVFQIPDHDWYVNQRLPWVLEPGEAISTAFRRDDFVHNMMQPGGVSLFRLLPWRSRATLLRHRATVAVSTRRTGVFGKVDKAITKALEMAFAEEAEALQAEIIGGPD